MSVSNHGRDDQAREGAVEVFGDLCTEYGVKLASLCQGQASSIVV